MKKKFIIWLIIIISILTIYSPIIVKAIGDINSTSTIKALKNNGRLKNHPDYNFIRHKPRSQFLYPRQAKEKNILNLLKLIDNYVSVIFKIIIEIFILPYLIYSLYLYIKNWRIKNKYKNVKNFEIRRCLDDGNKEERKKYYLIDKNKKTYQWIEDNKTFNEVFKKYGFERPSGEDEECFSKKDYKEEENICFEVNNLDNIINVIKILKALNLIV